MDARKQLLLSHTRLPWGKWCSKFGWITPSGLGGDSVIDRWTNEGLTDGRTHGKIMLLTMRGSDVAIWIPPSCLGGESVTDKWTDDGRTDRQMHRKNNAALAHPYYKRKWCCKFGRIPPSGLGGDSVTDSQTDERTNWLTDGRTDGWRR